MNNVLCRNKKWDHFSTSLNFRSKTSASSNLSSFSQIQHDEEIPIANPFPHPTIQILSNPITHVPKNGRLRSRPFGFFLAFLCTSTQQHDRNFIQWQFKAQPRNVDCYVCRAAMVRALSWLDFAETCRQNNNHEKRAGIGLNGFILLTLKEAGGSKMSHWSGECLSFLTWSCYGHKNSWLYP